MRNRLPLLAVILLILVADQWTKAVARAHLSGAPRHYANGLLTLILTENEGAFLSLGSTLPPAVRTAIFTVVVALAVLVAVVLLVRGSVRGTEALAVALVAGGGIGNLVDRIARGGRVTDFLYLAAGPLHTGVFNVADMAITGGVIWLAAASFYPRGKNGGATTPGSAPES
jgi:signal peptidase II